MKWNTFEIRDGRRVDTGTPVDGDDGYYIEVDISGSRDVLGPYGTEEEAELELKCLNERDSD